MIHEDEGKRCNIVGKILRGINSKNNFKNSIQVAQFKSKIHTFMDSDDDALIEQNM